MRRIAFAPALILAALLASCALGLDFNSYSNDCDPPNFDLPESSTFCSGTWGDAEPQELVTQDVPFRVSGAIDTFEQFVAVATLNSGPGDNCVEATYSVTLFERRGAALEEVAAGIADDLTAFAGGADDACFQFPQFDLINTFDIDIIDPLARRVALANGELGLILMELVATGGDPNEAAVTGVPAYTFVAPFDSPALSTACEAGRCRYVANADQANEVNVCLTNQDCPADTVCCPLRGGDGVSGCVPNDTDSVAALCNTMGACPPDSMVASGGVGRPDECVAMCESSIDCPGHVDCVGQMGTEQRVCRGATLCVTDGVTCRFGQNDGVCLDGGCRVECGSDADCGGPQACLDGFCIAAPTCEDPTHCGTGVFGGADTAVFDVDVASGTTLFVAAGYGGLFRLSINTDNEVQEVLRIDAAPIALYSDFSTDRMWSVDLGRGLVIYSLQTLLNADSETVPALGETELISGSDVVAQSGIAIAARDNRAFVLSGGIFSELNGDGTNGDVRLHEFELAGTSLTQLGNGQVVGVSTLPELGFIDERTLVVGLPEVVSTDDPGEDSSLLVRIFDVTSAGTLDPSDPLQVREFNEETQGEPSVLRGFHAGPGAVYIGDAGSIFPYFVRIDR